MHIGFLHTSAVHIAKFDTLLAELAPTAQVTHHVAEDLLVRARTDGLGAVQAGFTDALAPLLAADAVICTCSTLGPLTDVAARTHPHVFRIDRPMMEAACNAGPRIAVVLCLDSTRDATLAVLQDCATVMGRAVRPTVFLCDGAWALFEAGDMAGYAGRITQVVEDTMNVATYDCIVLAQASMGVAVEGLHDVGVPVLTSPRLAAERAISVASGRLE